MTSKIDTNKLAQNLLSGAEGKNLPPGLSALIATALAAASGEGGETEIVEVVNRGKEIIIPEGMTKRDARVWLKRQEDAEEQVVAIDETVLAFPSEGAYAFSKAIAKRYGFAQQVTIPGSFFRPDQKPTMIGIEIARGKTVQVPWGRVIIPNIDGYLQTGVAIKDGRWVLSIQGQVKAKHKEEIADLANLTREFVRTESLYKGRAIRVDFKPIDPHDPQFNMNDAPKFLELSSINAADLIFSDSVKRLIDVSVFAPIEKTDVFRKHHIPLKAGVLLEGPYGVGKTLTAHVAARKAEDNGWTFIYLDKVEDLEHAIRFAQAYQPAVIFAEDIDRVVTGERSNEMDRILNTIDGVEFKSSEVMVVLTTNHVENINPAMMRPGRLDTVISVQPPDAAAVLKLLALYGRGLIGTGEQLRPVAERLAGQIPAVIREVVERAKRSAASRLDVGAEMVLTAADLSTAAESMMEHLKFIVVRDTKRHTDAEKVAKIIGTKLAEAVATASRRNLLDVEESDSPSIHPANGKSGMASA